MSYRIAKKSIFTIDVVLDSTESIGDKKDEEETDDNTDLGHSTEDEEIDISANNEVYFGCPKMMYYCVIAYMSINNELTFKNFCFIQLPKG